MKKKILATAVLIGVLALSFGSVCVSAAPLSHMRHCTDANGVRPYHCYLTGYDDSYHTAYDNCTIYGGCHNTYDDTVYHHCNTRRSHSYHHR